MEKRFLRDIEVSEVGMGCMGFSHGYGKIPEERYSIEAIRMAYDHGCTFFDTAEVYSPNLSGIGHNELIVGKALRDVSYGYGNYWQSAICKGGETCQSQRYGQKEHPVRKEAQMIKIRWMGTPEDLKWFRQHLEEDKEIRLQNVSDRLPISTSNRYFRMMAEIEKIEDKEHTTGQKKDRRWISGDCTDPFL